MSSLLFILICCIAALIIHLWFYSDFFAFYFKFFKKFLPKRFYNWFLIEDYINNQDPNLNFDSYIEYLFVTRYLMASFIQKFFLKLFSCVLCLTTWISLLISLLLGNILYIGLVFIILRIFDFILRYTLKKAV